MAVAIAAALVCFRVRSFGYLELESLDVRFRHFSTLPRDPRIVHVDIDDNSLDRVGRWPWPRRTTADIIRAIHELGAAVIAVDLLIDDRQRPTFDDPLLSADTDIEPDPKVEGEPSYNSIVDDDRELADAVRTAGNVFISMHMQTVAPDEPDPLPVRLRQWYQDEPTITVGDVLARSGIEDTPEQRHRVRQALLRERIRAQLSTDFTLTNQQLADRLDVSRDEVFAVVAGVKTEVARERLGELLAHGEPLSLRQALVSILGDGADRVNADQADVMRAYRHQLGLTAVWKRSAPAPDDVERLLQRAYDAAPPHFWFVEAARGIGAVNFKRDMDGSVRRIPILIEHDGRLIKHLGFAVACHLLGVTDDQIEINNDRTVTFPDPAGGEPYVIPLDREGQVTINWAKGAAGWRVGDDFPHISAARIWAMVDKRNAIRDNDVAIALRHARIVQLVKGDSFEAYRRNVVQMNDLQHELHAARLDRRDATPEAVWKRSQLDELREYVRQEHAAAVSMIEMVCDDLRSQYSREELATDEEARTYLDAERLVKEEIAEYRAQNDELRREAEEMKKELTDAIADKVVFLGYAATALGDIVPTPIDPNTNGAMCHAHLLNTLLNKRFITRPSPALEIALVILLGAAVAVLTSIGDPRLTFAVTVAGILAYTAFISYVLFGGQSIWLVFGATVLTISITWAMVTLFRQLTAERERRFFAKQLGQYTSPAIAARLAESPDAAQAFKTVQSREVTCLFTDLASFTTLTEQESPETIQFVLNTYLERMSEVIWQRRGLINKFMGDGIMAFFNASVDPQTEHAENASAVTIEAFEALERLKIEQADGPAGPLFRRLQMRAGLATGVCKNGDFGSELKADYTVIGDTVNLAARLEPANKVFGTRIMVPAATRERIKDDYEFRYLAELRVKGKTKTVPVYEIVCRKGALSDDQRAYIERFEAGVELFKQRKWDECLVHFTRMLAKKPDDSGASRYIDACQELKSFPPDEDWNGALELKEK